MFGMVLGIILALAATIFSLFMIFAIINDRTILQDELQNGYLPYGKVATICAISTGVENKVWVYFNQDAQNGKVIPLLRKPINGVEVQVQGVRISYQPFLQLVGLQSIYKLTLLQGYFPGIENAKAAFLHPTSIPLNGGEDEQFQHLHSNPSPGVTASLDDPFTIQADGTTYDLFATPDGLSLSQASQQVKACGAIS